ncbi:MAG: class I SAM-dependent methyltransferase [Candidatus Zixiibacteriota bacterium]
MTLRIYERLSQVYDLDWSEFAKKYVSLINELLDERSLDCARILDLACGTGSLCAVLARQGHSVVGIDSSPEMIEKARSKLRKKHDAFFDVQEMSRFSVDGTFDLVTCTFDSINYLLTPKELKGAIGRISGAMKEAGLFIFDSDTHRHYLNHHQGQYHRQLAGESLVQKCIYDPEKLIATTVFEFSDGSLEIHKQRPYDLPELEPLLAGAGLRIVHSFADFDGRPFGSEDERLICVAEKAAVEKDL